MGIDAGLLGSQTRLFEFEDFVRIIPAIYAASPLGCAPGNSRFGGTDQSFAVLYAARDLATALAETVVRDRFVGSPDRRLFVEELVDRVAVQLRAEAPLRLIDLRMGGCMKLGIPTDIAAAKNFLDAQQFAQEVYQEAAIEGILYASRLTGENCVAVFDRAIEAHLEATHVAPLWQVQQVGGALASINVDLIR